MNFKNWFSIIKRKIGTLNLDKECISHVSVVLLNNF